MGKHKPGNGNEWHGVITLPALLVFILILSSCSRGAGTGTETGSGAEQPARPNIIMILADDIGYSNIGSCGSGIRTPNLDRLAAKYPHPG